jgi:hypothetical protein
VEEFGTCYADGEGGELVEDGPDYYGDVAGGLGVLLVSVLGVEIVEVSS